MKTCYARDATLDNISHVRKEFAEKGTMWKRDLVKHPMTVIFDWCEIMLTNELTGRTL
jgi:hypothetical protein